jgi:AraC family transcriptional regulator, melibiose operon regulatory protein
MATDRIKKPPAFTHGHRQRLDRAAEHFLHECYRQRKPARAKDFARSLDLKPEYVSWLAAKILGGSLHRFFRGKQLAYAARLLRRTPYSVEEIAERSGFGTRSTMHRWFVKIYGIGPAAFRAQRAR